MPDRVRLHIENDSSLGAVFEVTEDRLSAAFSRFPDLAERIDCSIGYDCADFDRQIADAHALVCWDIDHRNIAARAPELRWIHATGAGVEHFAPFDWLPEGVTFTNNRGVHGARAHEYAIMSVLMLNNRVPEMVTHQRAGRWVQTFNTGIAGKTLLVVGVGSVGGGVAEWARRFGMRVIGVRRTARPHPAVDEMQGPEALLELIPRADYIIATAPATAQTRHLIGKAEIEAIRPGGGIVNYGRARVVDYEALRARLERREISAILDVFDPEPLPPDSPLWRTPNLIVTPHCSSDDTELYIPRTLDLFFENMRRFLAGEPLENRVDPVLEY